MKILVIYNMKAGKKNALNEVQQAFKLYNVEVTYKRLSLELKKDVAHARKEGVQCVVAVGGDGTVSSVAGELQGCGLAMGIIAAGTLNHFAKDIGVPLEITKAVKVIIAGKTRQVDIASVNGHFFVNNSSIGLYPQLVTERQRHESQLGKWPAAVIGLVVALAKRRRFRAVISVDGDKNHRKTPFVFVGNNSYRLNQGGFNNRTRLDGGQLSVYWVNTAKFWPVLRIFWRALLGKPHPERDFEWALAHEVSVALRKARATVATDGEVQTMSTPLKYKSHPGALRVCVPK